MGSNLFQAEATGAPNFVPRALEALTVQQEADLAAFVLNGGLASIQAATAAAISAAALAQAATDGPVQVNPRRIVEPLTIPSTHNAASVGLIAVTDGAAVTVEDHATWSIS